MNIGQTLLRLFLLTSQVELISIRLTLRDWIVRMRIISVITGTGSVYRYDV